MKRDDDGLTELMRLKQWHWGKILILWIVVPALVGVGGAISVVALFPWLSGAAQVFMYFPPAISIIVMLVITWLWLTGKESR